MRIPLAVVQVRSRAEESWDSLLRGYLELNREGIQAALENCANERTLPRARRNG